MSQGLIYAIYNKETGQYYIGQTNTELNKVWKEHLQESSKMNPSPLHRSIRKYGAGKFNIRVIEECSIGILDDRELYWVKEYDSHNNGYNELTVIEETIPPIVEEIVEEIEPEPITIVKKEKKNSNSKFTKRGDGKHRRIKVKTINVDTLEEKFYDSLTECADALDTAVPNLHRYIKHGWRVRGHRVIKLEDKPSSHAIYGVDKITNKVKHSFRSVNEAGRTLGSGNTSGVDKSLKNPHKYTWKGCYWFYQ